MSKIYTELDFIENNRDKVAEYQKDKRELFDKENEFKNNLIEVKKKQENNAQQFYLVNEDLKKQINLHKTQIENLTIILNKFNDDINAYTSFKSTENYLDLKHYISCYLEEHKTEKSCILLISELQTTEHTITKNYIELQEAIHKFTSYFNENNIFSYKVKFIEKSEYFEFSEMLKEFIEENKIDEYKLRVEERFAQLINLIGKETNSLIEKEGEISKIITEINNDFITRNFVGAIKSMELKTIESKNKIFNLLVEIKNFNEENIFQLGKLNLFTTDEHSNKNKKAISLLIQLIKEINLTKEKEITLSDSFELLFKIVENDNDTGWVEKLTNVGSEGTDILVKAMVNIMLLNVFKDKATKKKSTDFRLHCMMDEIGKLHPSNVKGILKFANDRNILLINSSPTSLNAMDYRYTYLLTKDTKNITNIIRLIKKN